MEDGTAKRKTLIFKENAIPGQTVIARIYKKKKDMLKPDP